MSNTISFIIQARFNSTRLPGKICLPFYNNQTILDIQLNNLLAFFPGSSIIIATTTLKADDVIAEKYSSDARIKIFRGNENNVLKRFIDAAKSFGIQHIIRICSDNPFLSMSHLKLMIDRYLITLPDYISFRFANGAPSIRSHCGLFAEMVNLKALEMVQKGLTSTAPFYLEHVTNYIYSNPQQFNIEFIPVPAFLNDYFDTLRLTVDTEQDFVNLKKLYLAVLNGYGSNFTIEQLITEVEKDKNLLNIMKEQIRQYAK